MKTITICGIEYEIIITQSPFFEQWGNINHQECVITLDGKPKKQIQDETFIHEFIHGILAHTGDIGEHDEKMVRRIANGLFQSGIRMDSFNIKDDT